MLRGLVVIIPFHFFFCTNVFSCLQHLLAGKRWDTNTLKRNECYSRSNLVQGWSGVIYSGFIYTSVSNLLMLAELHEEDKKKPTKVQEKSNILCFLAARIFFFLYNFNLNHRSDKIICLCRTVSMDITGALTTGKLLLERSDLN